MLEAWQVATPLWQVPVPQVRHAQRPTSLATSTAPTSRRRARSMSCRSMTHSCTFLDSDELLACIKACSSTDTLCHISMKAWGSTLDPHGKSGASHLDLSNSSIQCATSSMTLVLSTIQHLNSSLPLFFSRHSFCCEILPPDPRDPYPYSFGAICVTCHKPPLWVNT